MQSDAWVNADGYRVQRIEGRLEYEHRLVWTRHFGPIPVGWVVHHKNEDKLDNRLGNLELLPRGQHARHHATLRREKWEK